MIFHAPSAVSLSTATILIFRFGHVSSQRSRFRVHLAHYEQNIDVFDTVTAIITVQNPYKYITLYGEALYAFCSC